MEGKKVNVKKENIKKIIEFAIVLTFIFLPFISITNIVGMETFLDSFENPESYVYIKNINEFTVLNAKKPSYVIIQKTEHPTFHIKESDMVLYSTLTGEIICDKIDSVHTIGPIYKYELRGSSFRDNSESIYKEQIIGKVIKIVDEDIWNTLMIKTWGATIYNLNINSLLE